MSRRSQRAAKTLAPVPRRAAILATMVTTALEDLGINVTLHVGATPRTYQEWYPLSQTPNIMQFEFDLAVVHRRWRYNGRCVAQAHRQQTPVLGQHAGFSDFFVPVGAIEGARGTLTVGPFATARPTSGDVLARWRSLSGAHGRLGDPMFAHYVSVTLQTLTLDGR